MEAITPEQHQMGKVERAGFTQLQHERNVNPAYTTFGVQLALKTQFIVDRADVEVSKSKNAVVRCC